MTSITCNGMPPAQQSQNWMLDLPGKTEEIPKKKRENPIHSLGFCSDRTVLFFMETNDIKRIIHIIGLSLNSFSIKSYRHLTEGSRPLVGIYYSKPYSKDNSITIRFTLVNADKRSAPVSQIAVTFDSEGVEREVSYINYPLDIICFDKEENGAIRAKTPGCGLDFLFF